MLRRIKSPLTSIRGKIILSFILLILIPITIIIYNVYVSSQEVVRREVNQSRQEAVRHTASSIDGTAERMLNASHLIVNDPEVAAYLQTSHRQGWMTDYPSFQQFTSVHKKLMNIRDILLDSNAVVALLDFGGHVLSTAAGFEEPALYEQLRKEAWVQETLRLEGWPYWQLAYQGTLLPPPQAGAENSLFVMSRLIKDSSNGKAAGLLLIGLPSPMETSALPAKTTGTDRVTLLIKKDGQLLDQRGPVLPQEVVNLALRANALSPQEEYRSVQADGQRFALNGAFMPHLGWTVVQLAPEEELQSSLGQIKNQSLLWLLIWFLIFTCAFAVVMLQFAKRIGRLLHSMDRVGQGDFSSRVSVRGSDEVSQLGLRFNEMVGRLEELILRLSEEQRRKEEARFQALQAQINPHFLFNTLNSIKWSAMLSGAQHVSQMITKLGKLLEISMRAGRERTTLQEELSHLEMYMDLQKLRFHDNIRVHVEVPERLMSCEILQFTLQPIVENSIIHGNRSPLEVSITAHEEGDKLVLTISDNGQGMEPDQLERVFTDGAPSHAKSTGIGIRNVNERIAMHFGPGYGLRLSSVPGEGTTVTVTLPLAKEATQHD
ncbi:sensor histidine kinase [Paenibacillus naphthalenovorans]|uniref:histidine kinase n=1 Tax=Paenibacillus naphthalenovorans TaxID=162209 RepID=A0A0U2WEZ9_9BACL|nr:histidine kinase [Paenibacillus naphthalenovorans]ALS24958.1 histidine kinase [Paenibacillus naphthalenovorans]